MGEIAEMMMEGTLCSCCGVFLDIDSDGLSAMCEECKKETKKYAKNRSQRSRSK